MKKTLILMTLILIWCGNSNAGELKVQIPVNDYEKIQSRLDALESENNRLMQEVRTLESTPAPASAQPSASTKPDAETANMLSALENENDQLKREIQSLQDSQETVAISDEDDDINSRISSLEDENVRLIRKIKSYKERGVRVLDNDRRSARHIYRDMRK